LLEEDALVDSPKPQLIQEREREREEHVAMD
jgi:hypothetical protein